MKYWVVIAHSYLQTGPSLGWDPGGGGRRGVVRGLSDVGNGGPGPSCHSCLKADANSELETGAGQENQGPKNQPSERCSFGSRKLGI